ncbi:gamma-interferon-inducible lysosomal thiol reductase-like [Drosophila obscura]|uniref:gamma-interferon-inducible lysosomal thiol reductase-like n=1 Tax=Drosophila obscura TaxID=7282 RepID=UPI001BB29EDF|nr:gamma-interferon-inducible lysosomal thiol reductase-like [Drosophila obscura]
MSMLLFLLLVWQVLPPGCVWAQKRLNMTVLYESLCMDSVDYLTSFLPIFKELNGYINLNLVPYGKASEGGKFCQHGPRECKGNSIQDCALHTSMSQLEKLIYVTCQMTNDKFVTEIDTNCINSSDTKQSITECMGKYGNRKIYQRQSGRITSMYEFSQIPAIIYNDRFNESLQDEATEEVKKSICIAIIETGMEEPTYCSNGTP